MSGIGPNLAHNVPEHTADPVNPSRITIKSFSISWKSKSISKKLYQAFHSFHQA